MIVIDGKNEELKEEWDWICFFKSKICKHAYNILLYLQLLTIESKTKEGIQQN
ncbi:hypothetical protein HYC85_002095 [Camellia sinensis]|uniref:Uncharacterized protein n=1 Tax=Camellia sinensis TaxID=4442 RepID=A0A7J7I8K0_CAMSI|nr:hypothetical protein HYC85_002095 [Camellia sinensis]